ncbi:PucR family transcriptional regulator [Wenjunlia tyrosinilytica]|uniref:Transcriptional regulator n=1 Tax=Wenjunlia tyrosinilytica TaxID=1544741 RepID=A0A917ZWC6_9ACTN|nr:helix-turn-helix domain-containing protein [Wenjunlia tyrosinilytica]GGO97687.1 transcriptional regulator [Wenjunlia tyrosinilytica]
MELPESPTLDGTSEELFALANAIAAVIGGSVAIEDLDHRVLAYSSLPGQRIDELRRRGILNRRVPDQPEQLRQYRDVLAATGVVRLAVLAPDELPRAAVAIRAGDLPLGTIWAIEADTPIDADGGRALLDGARLAALHMLRRRSAAELEMRAHEDALRGALDGGWGPEEARFRLGLPDRPRLTLLGLAPAGVPERGVPLAVRLSAAAARHWAAVHAESAVATVGRTVYVLLPHDSPATARRLAEQAVAALGRTLDATVRAAVSRQAADPAELPELRAEVDDILRVTTTDPDAPPVSDLAATHARVLLVHLSDQLARRPGLRHPGIDAMVEHDRARGTDYAASVTAWLDAVGNVAEAAQRLTVHPNTLKYRLRRARELFGIDLDHPDDRLSCWLQLRLQRQPPAPVADPAT